MVTTSKNVLNKLRSYLQSDMLSLFYQGRFDHQFTTMMIELGRSASESLTNRTGKNRLGFLMAESFQNLVKHGLVDGMNNPVSREVFGLRNIDPFMHILSSNFVDLESAKFLKEKLGSLDNMSTDELNAHYIDILRNGTISQKGGAGLGLIEMSRKSKQPLQHKLFDVENGELNDEKGFALQIDILMDRSLIGQELDKLSLEENFKFYQLLQKENVLFFFNGDFTKETIVPVLNILKQNVEANLVQKGRFNKLYHVSVELFQNVMRHGLEIRGIKFGSFVLSIDGDFLSLSTGNYLTSEQCEALKSTLDKLNSLDRSELDSLYMHTLRESALSDSDSGNVGLIDVARLSAGELKYEVVEDHRGLFFAVTSYFK